MDIVVHGTKGGRQIFTPKKIGGLLDINADASKAAAIGQEAFAIRFVENSIIFSKYKIIRDVRGDKRTGFLGFSLFISNNQYLPGNEIISLLNKVSEEYCRKYIPDNDNNLKDVREEWGFLDDILNDYRIKVKNRSVDDIETLLSGTKDDAFAFYEDEEKLEKYIDQPYQQEYKQYRQILFIRNNLKDKPECPLNALRHSDNPNDNLTGRIDLEKRIYVLKDFDGSANNGISIEISVRGRRLRRDERISSKDLISIRYFKKYFKDLIVKEGRISDDWIKKYLFTTDETSKSIQVEKNIGLDPVEKCIQFSIKDWQKKELKGATIQCISADGENKNESNNEIKFGGNELGKRWYISAKTEWLYSDDRLINFELDCPLDSALLDIYVNKHKINITALDSLNGDILDNLKISKQEFTGNELRDTHKIAVSKQGYELFTFNYCPVDNYKSPIHIKLSKRPTHDTNSKSEITYTASVGDHGSWMDGTNYDLYTKSSRGFDLESKIKPQNGWRFVKFEKNGDSLTAKYEKIGKFESPKKIAIAIVTTIVFVISIWILYSIYGIEEPEKSQHPQYQKLNAYIEGNLLFLDTLENYKNFLNENQIDLSNKLDSAIQIRKLINSKDFETLKKMHFSPLQQEFFESINKIQNDQFNKIKDKFGNIATWSLTKIKDSINIYLEKIIAKEDDNTREEINEEESNGRQPIIEKIKADNDTQENASSKPNVSVIPNRKSQEQAASAFNTTKISSIGSELKQSTITKEKLQEYKKTENNELAKSIELYLRFWEFVKSSQKMDDFKKLFNEVKADKNLKNSELRYFLNTICTNSESFQKFNSISGKSKYNTISTLKSRLVQ